MEILSPVPKISKIYSKTPFKTKKNKKISVNTIKSYLDYLCDAFIVSRATRYDIKGKKYIDTPQKYYFSDVGLRNARINFRQIEENHTMENILFNELLMRGFNVDVGVVSTKFSQNGKQQRKQLEVDFVCNKGPKRFYIQSAFSMPDAEKRKQEEASLLRIDDSFGKIIVTCPVAHRERRFGGQRIRFPVESKFPELTFAPLHKKYVFICTGCPL